MLTRKQIDDPLVVLVEPIEIAETARQLAEWLAMALCSETDCTARVDQREAGKYTLCEVGSDEPFPCDKSDAAARAWLEGEADDG